MDDVCICENGYLSCFSFKYRYVGETCDVQCPGFIENDESVCNGFGDCDLKGNTAVCTCIDNKYFKQPDCNPICPGTSVDGEIVIPCSGHGECESEKCECHPGYYGDDCNSSCPGLVTIDGILKECSGNGKCVEEKGVYKCKCNGSGFDEETCGAKCNWIETCNRRGLCNL